MKRKAVFIITLLFLSNFTFAQVNNENLKNRHSIGFYGGFKGNSAVEAAALPATVNLKTGFMGGIEYGYWFTDEWQVGLNFGAVAANMNVNVANVESNAVAAFQFGFKYYPAALKLGDVGRFYAGLFAGPYIGMGTKTAGFLASSNTFTETVVGGQLSVGADLFVARWLKIGPSLNLTVMGDLKEISIEKKNFGGVGFVINFGIVL